LSAHREEKEKEKKKKLLGEQAQTFLIDTDKYLTLKLHEEKQI
jgi:hypothetical protein